MNSHATFLMSRDENHVPGIGGDGRLRENFIPQRLSGHSAEVLNKQETESDPYSGCWFVSVSYTIP